MLKLLIPVLAMSIVSLAATVSNAADEGWRDKALELAKEEPKVRDAIWSQNISFWISVDDDGSSRDGYASYMCFVLRDAGKPEGEFVSVRVWDHVSMATNSPKQLGQASCQ
ncbi:hypothetical protein ABWH89_05150 [Hoeflea alexandrii]|uniref:hypothetical protein n=1 Tax=Hoeflea alexandrii TaxID=288436 RepID=UPI0035D0267D